MMISSEVTGVEMSCSIVPRSHSRATVSDVSNTPTTAITIAATPGTMKFLLSRSSLNQVRASTDSTGFTVGAWDLRRYSA